MTSLDQGPLRDPDVEGFFGSMAEARIAELQMQEEIARREGKPFQEHETQRHMETQQGVQELQAQQQMEAAQQVEQLNAQQLMEEIYMSGRRVPEPGEVPIEDRIAQASTRLPPEQVTALQETYQQGRHNTEQLMRFENQIHQIFMQEAGEQVQEERPAGEGAGLPPSLMLELARAAKDIGKSIIGGFTGADYTRRGDILRQIRELIAAKLSQQETGGPEAFQGIAPEEVEAMLHRSAERVVEGGFQRLAEGGSRAFGEEYGHVASWLMPLKIYGKIGKVGINWLTVGLPRELAAKGTRAAKLGAWFLEKSPTLPVAFGFRMALPLSDQDMFWIEGQPEEEREALEWGVKVHRAAQWSAMLPFYGLAGTIAGQGARASRYLMGVVGTPEKVAGAAGGLVGGYGSALVLPDAGAIGEQMLVKLAEGMDIPSFLKALQAEGEVQGPILAIMGKIGTAPAEEVWDDIIDYLGATATSGGGSAFMALGVAHGLGFKFQRKDEAKKKLKEARKNLRESGEEPEILEAIEKDLERMAEEMSPTEAQERGRAAVEALEAEKGGREEARRAVREAVAAEEVPLPEGREARETTTEARREALREEAAEVREKRPTEETQRSLDALMAEDLAASLRQKARGRTDPESRKIEAEAEAMSTYARDIRAGKEPKAPTPEAVEKAEVEAVPARRLAREVKEEQAGPEIAERLVEEARVAKEAEAAKKPLHELPLADYLAEHGVEPRPVKGRGQKAESEATAYLRTEHQAAVKKALATGKEVPPEVMVDYPTEVMDQAHQAAKEGYVPRATYLQGQLAKGQAQIAEARKKKPRAGPPRGPKKKGKKRPTKAEAAKTQKEAFKPVEEARMATTNDVVSGSKPEPGQPLPKDAVTKRKSHKAYLQAELFKERQDAIDAMEGVEPVDGKTGLSKEINEAWEGLKDKDVSSAEAPKRPAEGVFHPGPEKAAEARIPMMEKAAIDLLPHQEKVELQNPTKKQLEGMAKRAKEPLHRIYYEKAAKLKGEVPDTDLDIEALYATLKEFSPDSKTDTWSLMAKITEMRGEFERVRQRVIDTSNTEFWLRWGAQRPELSGPFSVAARYSPTGRRLISDIDSFQQVSVLPSLLSGHQGGFVYVPGVTFVHRMWGRVVNFIRGQKISTIDEVAGTTSGDPQALAARRNALKRKFGAWFGTALGQWGQLGKEVQLAVADQYKLLSQLERYYFGFHGLFRKYRHLFPKESSLDPLDMDHPDKILTLLIESKGEAREKWAPEHQEYWDNLPPEAKKVVNNPEFREAASTISETLEPLRRLMAEHSNRAMFYKTRAREAEEEIQAATEKIADLESLQSRMEMGFAEFASQRERIAEIKAEIKRAKAEEDPDLVRELEEEARILGGEVYAGMQAINARIRARATAEAVEAGKTEKQAGWAAEKAIRDEGLTITPENVGKLIGQERARIKAAKKRHKSMMDLYEDWVENVGYKRAYMHSITAEDHTSGSEVDAKKLFDLIEQQPSDEVLGRMLIDIPDRRQARSMFQRTGKMGPTRDLSAKRSIYHYIRDLAGAVPLNKFLFKWGPRLLGKMRRVRSGEILRPSSKGVAGDLFYDNGKYRGLGEVIEYAAKIGEGKEPGRVFLRESELSPETKAEIGRVEAARGAASMGGVPSRMPRVKRRILLYRGEDAASTKLNNPKWVADNLKSGNLRALTRRTAFSRVRARSPGLLRQLAAITPAEHANFKSWFGRVMRESELIRGTVFDKDFEKALNVSAKLVSAKVMGLFRVSSAIRAASAAAIYNGGILGSHRAVADMHLPFLYAGMLSRAKLTGDTFRDLMEWKIEPLESGKIVTDPLEARLKEAVEKSDIAKASGNAEHFAEAVVEFYRSSILQGHRGLAFFMRRFVRPGQKLKGDPVTGAGRWLIDKGWVPFDTGERYVRAHMYLSSFMRYRAAGKSREYAAQQAMGATMALHGVFNKASKSAFMAHPAGQLLGSIMAWRHHWHGTFLRMPRHEKAKFLAYLHLVTIGGTLFGLSMEDILGVALKDMFGGLPVLSKPAERIALATRGIGISTDEDALGLQPKPVLEFLPGGEPEMLKQAREELTEYIKNLPAGNDELKAVIAKAQRLLMGDFTALEMGPVSPIDPLTVESPGTDLLLKLVELGEAIAYGSEQETMTALERLGSYAVPGIVTDYMRAEKTEEVEPGQFAYTPPFSEKVTRYLESTGFEQFFRDLRPGRDLEEQLQFYRGQEEKRIEELKAKAAQDLKEQGKEYLRRQELLRGLRRERQLTPEETEEFREQGRALRQRGIEIERPVTRQDLNLWREEITQWENMDSEMRSVTRIRTKAQKIEALAKMLERGTLTQQQWNTMMRVNKPRTESLGEWVGDVAPRIRNRFRAAYREAREGWR
jgi:hypothetical protein